MGCAAFFVSAAKKFSCSHRNVWFYLTGTDLRCCQIFVGVKNKTKHTGTVKLDYGVVVVFPLDAEERHRQEIRIQPPECKSDGGQFRMLIKIGREQHHVYA